MRVYRGERYRIYPSKDVVARFDAWQHALRWLWNHCHAERVAKADGGFFAPTAFDQIRDLTVLRATRPWLADVPRDMCGQLLMELDKAWKCTFAGIRGRPKYKSRKFSDTAPMIAPQKFRIEGRGRSGFVILPKVGPVKAVIHRQPFGTVKTCALICDAGDWFACVSCEKDVDDPVVSTKPAVGLDRGVVKLIADSNGGFVENTQALSSIKSRIAKAERSASRKKKGGANQQRAFRRVAKLHQLARRQRAAVLHRASRHYAENQGVVVVERLNIGNMVKSAKGTIDKPGTNVAQKSALNSAIRDSGWGKLLYMLKYKSELTGARVVEVSAAYSSQTCAVCQHVSKESRKTRDQFECVACGHRDHADTNAAKVILRRGTHGAEGFGGDAARGRPVRKQLRAVKRATRRDDQRPNHDAVSTPR